MFAGTGQIFRIGVWSSLPPFRVLEIMSRLHGFLCAGHGVPVLVVVFQLLL